LHHTFTFPQIFIVLSFTKMHTIYVSIHSVLRFMGSLNPNDGAVQSSLRDAWIFSLIHTQRNFCRTMPNNWRLTAENADHANGSNELYTAAHKLTATPYAFSRGLWTDECKCLLFETGWEDMRVISNVNWRWTYSWNSLKFAIPIARKICICS